MEDGFTTACSTVDSPVLSTSVTIDCDDSEASSADSGASAIDDPLDDLPDGSWVAVLTGVAEDSADSTGFASDDFEVDSDVIMAVVAADVVDLPSMGS